MFLAYGALFSKSKMRKVNSRKKQLTGPNKKTLILKIRKMKNITYDDRLTSKHVD